MKHILIVVLLTCTSVFVQAQHPSADIPKAATFSSERFVLRTEPLYVLSTGQTITEKECKALADHNRVSALRVLPVAEAIEKYGERANAGAVIVTLKDTSFTTEFLNRKRHAPTH